MFRVLFGFDINLYIITHQFKIPKPSRRRVGFEGGFRVCRVDPSDLIRVPCCWSCFQNVDDHLYIILHKSKIPKPSRRRVRFEGGFRGCRVDALDLIRFPCFVV